MHIGFLGNASSIHVIKLVNYLSKKGNKVSLFSIHEFEMEKINKAVYCFKLPVANASGYYLNFFTLKRLLKKYKVDVLNTHYASGYGTLSRLVNFKPTLLSVWGSDVYSYPYKSKINEYILKKNLNTPLRIASTSKAMKRQVEIFTNRGKDIEITPFGVDMDLFKPKKNIKKEYITIGIVKSLKEVYGIDYLLKAVSSLKQVLQNENKGIVAGRIRLLIIGSGELKPHLVKMSEVLNISDITSFIDAVPNEMVPAYMDEMDIFCMPSLSESFGVAALEASAMQLPVVASNVGGIPEVVKENVTGYLVEKQSVNELTKALYNLVTDENTRKQMGINGRLFVKENYDIQDNLLALERVYQDLLG